MNGTFISYSDENMEFPDRIPAAVWLSSQLSIARFYGAINVNGKKYIVDRETNDLVVVKRKKNRA